MKARMPRVDVRKNEIDKASSDVDKYYSLVEEVVNLVVTEVTSELDDLLSEVKDYLTEYKRNLDLDSVSYYVAMIPTSMYFVSDKMEDIGIKSDSSTSIRRERFDHYYQIAKGRTIQDKTTETNRLIANEMIMEDAYKRAYKKIQHRLDYAESTLNSLKKIMNTKTVELQITQQNTSAIPLGNRRKPVR